MNGLRGIKKELGGGAGGMRSTGCGVRNWERKHCWPERMEGRGRNQKAMGKGEIVFLFSLADVLLLFQP